MSNRIKVAAVALITIVSMTSFVAMPAFADDGGSGGFGSSNHGWWQNWFSATPSLPQTNVQSTVTLSAGWNLVDQAVLDALQVQTGQVYSDFWNGNSYQSTATSVADGLWVYTATSTTIAVPAPSISSKTITIGAKAWGMIGNPYSTSVSVTLQQGDVAYTYDPSTAQYSQAYTGTVSLAPGQGAWLFSAAGGNYSVGIQPPSPPSNAGTVTGSVYGMGTVQ